MEYFVCGLRMLSEVDSPDLVPELNAEFESGVDGVLDDERHNARDLLLSNAESGRVDTMKKRTVAALAPAAGIAGIAGIALQDLLQKEHALRRNFPVVARLRYLLESVGPELRQYIIATNDSERPFSRDQRRWVYARPRRRTTTSRSARTTT